MNRSEEKKLYDFYYLQRVLLIPLKKKCALKDELYVLILGYGDMVRADQDVIVIWSPLEETFELYPSTDKRYFEVSLSPNDAEESFKSIVLNTEARDQCFKNFGERDPYTPLHDRKIRQFTAGSVQHFIEKRLPKRVRCRASASLGHIGLKFSL